MQWWCTAQTTAWEWRWTPYPGVWLFIAALGASYVWWLRRAEKRGDVPVSRGKRLSFLAGLVVLWAALDWPLGPLGAGYLASVHMVQFLLIAMISPPLLLAGLEPLVAGGGSVHGTPGGGPGAEPAGGGSTGSGRSSSRRSWSRAVRALTHPVTTLALFSIILGWTHWPRVVDTLMATQLGNFTLDTLWLAAGLLFWWPVMVGVPHRAWLGEPLKMGYLLAGTIVNTGVFVYLTFSELPVYATYELAPPVTGITTREDQMLAGLLMKMGGALVLWTAITVVFFRWVTREGGRAGR